MLAILAESALRALILGSAVWAGLHVFRVRNPGVQMTSWVVVLIASLSMPLLMQWATVTLTLDPSPGAAPADLLPGGGALSEAAPASGASEPANAGSALDGKTFGNNSFNWWALATAIYVFVAAVLLLRLAIGVCLTWRLVRAARPIHEPWTAAFDVRVSDVIGGPVTFGSTVLVPPQCRDWDARKRKAVLAHERAHIAQGDFYILLLASLNRAVFWFSPFAWWQFTRLAELSEIISDARAIEVVEDRLSYAEILLEMMQHVRRVPAALEMARACTVRKRVERILEATTDTATAGWWKKLSTAAVVAPVVIISAGSIAYRTAPDDVARPEPSADLQTPAAKPVTIDFYSVGSKSVFAVSREGDELFGQMTGQRKQRLSGAPNGTLTYLAANGPMAVTIGNGLDAAQMSMRQNGHDLQAVRVARLSTGGVAAEPARLESYVGWYELAPNRVLSVTRAGDRLLVEETGRSKVEVRADAADAFSGRGDSHVLFLRDAQGRVTRVLFQEPSSGARIAPRVDAARAGIIEGEFARRIAEIPERFREQSPAPGGKDAILHGISDMQRGAPNYDRMSASLAAKVRGQFTQLHAMLEALGAVESIFFRGVGPGGYDIYGVKFANGSAEFRLLLGPGGKADDVTFRPDGNDAPGRFAACSDERTVRPSGSTVPISLFVSNDSGQDIQLYRLDSGGNRVPHSTIGQNMSSTILTEVDAPWVIADMSGQCLEIVLPGQRTRWHSVEARRAASDPERAVSRRIAPLAGSEETLRQYVESLGRGDPIYDRMTPEVAAQTRQQLPFNRAIINKLGALRAMSFRGVTDLGSDIYVAHFANGSAEWRIGLQKDGSIGRIALGPQ